jgi:hypothetical protein
MAQTGGRRGAIGNRGRNVELEPRARIQLAPYIQTPAYKFGAFAHAVQAVVSGTPVLDQNLRVDALSVNRAFRVQNLTWLSISVAVLLAIL